MGDVRLPEVTVVKRFKPFMEDDLNEMFLAGDVTLVIAHPKRRAVGGNGQGDDADAVVDTFVGRMSDVDFATDKDASSPRRILVAVG